MIRETLWVVGLTTMIAIPLVVPDSMKVTIVIPDAYKQQHTKGVHETVCQLRRKFISPQGLQVCEYSCDGTIIYKSMFSKSIICESTIKERVNTP